MHRRTVGLLAALVLALAASANASAPAPASYPSVTLRCYPDGIWCEATASGGSGSGYTFEWSDNIAEQYDADGYSWGDVLCYGYIGTRTVYVTVTDGLGGQTGDAASFYCQP